MRPEGCMKKCFLHCYHAMYNHIFQRDRLSRENTFYQGIFSLKIYNYTNKRGKLDFIIAYFWGNVKIQRASKIKVIMIIESRNAKPFRQADKIGFC